MIEQGMEYYRRKQSGHENQDVLWRFELCEKLRADSENSGGSSMHDRRPQASHDPDDEVRVRDGSQVVGILKQRKACSHGESENGSVNEKSGPLGADEPGEDEGLG